MSVFRTVLLSSFFVFSSVSGFSQPGLPLANTGLKSDLQKVIADFPKQFVHLKGDIIAENPQSTDYACNLQFNGAEENSITQYSSKNPMYSWQAVMLTSEDFEEAAKKYKWLCNQLKNMTITMSDYSFSLTGNYEAPDDGKKFTSSIYRLIPNAINMPKLKVEASLQFSFPEWKVNLTVYEREREDSERGEKFDD
jgi:hypothetical protein